MFRGLRIGLMSLVLLAVSSAAQALVGSEDVVIRFLACDGTALATDVPIDCHRFTFLVIHGFRDRGTAEACLRQAAAIQHRYPQANVIIVDWQLTPKPAANHVSVLGLLAAALTSVADDYRRATEVAPRVAREIAQWMKQQGIRPSRTVFSGHSLGAQIAAFASNETAKAELYGEPVRAIVAADPAGPRFRDKPPTQRLDAADAHDVVVVHTTDILGYGSPAGTVDIYVTWPETDKPDAITRHSQARELVTASFLQPGMANTDGTPFGANALGLDHKRGSGNTGERIQYQVVSISPELPGQLLAAHAAGDTWRTRRVEARKTPGGASAGVGGPQMASPLHPAARSSSSLPRSASRTRLQICRVRSSFLLTVRAVYPSWSAIS